MNDISATTAPQINWASFASSPVNALTDTLESMLENFGPEDMGQALAQQHLGAFIDTLRTAINDTNELPQLMKDLANSILDSFQDNLSEMCPCSQEAADAVASSDVAGDIEDAAVADAETALPTEAPAGAEASEEAVNEGTTEVGGLTATDLVNDLAADAGETDEKKNGKGSWLEVLAGSLADIQSKFLDKAMVAKDEMEKNASQATEGQSSAFLKAQGDYTANMQMFTIFSNQTSTTIKSIGEALGGISRKQ